MAETHDDAELKALNDAIQIERDPKRLYELVERMIEVLDGHEKKVPAGARGK